tara:strand:+ start:566 stop:1009 length:444 start_codon:yes stop_codon:yes gene_type:complete
MPIKSFRGKIADEGIDVINLHTNNGSTGYKITKLQIISSTPGTAATEHTVKIFKIPQTTATAGIDLSDNTLLAVGYIENGSSAGNMQPEVIIFDNEIFNQDIYVTHVDENGTTPCNYYIELEQIKLDLTDNTMATLKDIKNIEASYL